jgi:hypothetical protein
MKIITMRRVYVASPCRGQREVNIRYLKMAMLDSLARMKLHMLHMLTYHLC